MIWSREKLLLAMAGLMLLSGCAATLTERAARIQVHSQMSSLLNSCEKIGPVSGSVENALLGPDPLASQAKANVRDAVAEKGGDTLVITNIDTFRGFAYNKVVVQGVALRCY